MSVGVCRETKRSSDRARRRSEDDAWDGDVGGGGGGGGIGAIAALSLYSADDIPLVRWVVSESFVATNTRSVMSAGSQVSSGRAHKS